MKPQNGYALVDKEGNLMWMRPGNAEIPRIYATFLQAERARRGNFRNAEVVMIRIMSREE